MRFDALFRNENRQARTGDAPRQEHRARVTAQAHHRPGDVDSASARLPRRMRAAKLPVASTWSVSLIKTLTMDAEDE